MNFMRKFIGRRTRQPEVEDDDGRIKMIVVVVVVLHPKAFLGSDIHGCRKLSHLCNEHNNGPKLILFQTKNKPEKWAHL